MTIYKLCAECRVHPVEDDEETCSFCRDEDTDPEIDPRPVDQHIKRSEGKRIAEGFRLLRER